MSRERMAEIKRILATEDLTMIEDCELRTEFDELLNYVTLTEGLAKLRAKLEASK